MNTSTPLYTKITQRLLNFSLPKAALLLLMALLFLSASAQAQTTYYWIGKANNKTDSFNNGDNWSTSTTGTPAGRVPAPTDILVFRGGIGSVFPATGIVVDLGTGSTPVQQTIAQMRVESGGTPATAANVSFSAATTGANGAFLNMVGGAGITNAFVIEAGSSLNFIASGNTQNRFIGIIIGAGQIARIAGNMTENVVPGTPNRFVAPNNASINFLGTATFNLIANNGNVFGTTGAATFTTPRVDYFSTNSNPIILPDFTDVTTTNSVNFTDGSTFIQQGSVDPFGPGSTPVTQFSPGSLYTYNSGTFAPGGQTYGNLKFDGGSNTATVTGIKQMVVLNDLTMPSGTLNLSLTGTGTGTNAAVSIGGSLFSNGGTLNFSPASTSTVAFNGPVSLAINAIKQSIGGTGTLSFSSLTVFEINNAQGLTLDRTVTLSGGLRLSLGLITTFTNTPLTLTSSASVIAGSGSDASFVNGPVARTTIATSTPTNFSLLFPVGKLATSGDKGGRYRPLTLNTTNQTNAITFVGEQIETPPTQNVDATLTRVSFRRYFNVTPNVAPATSTATPFSATITLSFGADDFVNFPADITFVIAKRNQPVNWTSIGRGANTGTANGGLPVAGTLTSGPFTSFSDFSLASTSTTGNPNPLPVELTRFAATAKLGAIALNWATASEKNSDYFDVQRSATGEAFQTIATVKAQGTSSSARDYAALDARPLAGTAYYRLRQVDTDGTVSISAVVTVRTLEAGRLAVYPNPSAGVVTLPAALGVVQYRVFNALGQTLLRGQATGNEQLDLRTLVKGSYFLELTGEAGRSTQRLVRE